MPMLLGAKGKDILKWRPSAELVASLKGSMAGKWGRSSASEAEGLLRRFIDALGDELGYENELLKEIAALDHEIDEAASPEHLQPLLSRYREVVSAHFRRRQSVLAVCSICNKLHDRMVRKALSLAQDRMLELGQGAPPIHALIVCGDRGRGEETLRSHNRYLLLHDEEGSRSFLFSRQLSGILREAGLLAGEELFWHGSLPLWRSLLTGRSSMEGDETHSPFTDGPRQMPEWEWRLEAMSDLALVAGDPKPGSAALDAAARALLEERNRAAFMQLARRVITLPLALGRFGRWRLEREGEHRGEVNLEELAIRPLVMTIRVLAVQAGITSGGTVQRIESLLERGVLSVELSERLLKSYQCLMQLRILSEIRCEQSGAFCTVEDLDREEDERLRASLDTVLSLQKIAYQRIISMG